MTTTPRHRPDSLPGVDILSHDVYAQRVPRIVRDPFGLTYKVGTPKTHAKATIPGHGYGSYGNEINNMGDPRIARYILTNRTAENEYPGNASPNRRTVRRSTIYNSDPSPRKTRHYGRVLPSEWPDGGHDSPLAPPGALATTFPLLSDDAIAPTDPRFNYVPTPKAENAPQALLVLAAVYALLPCVLKAMAAAALLASPFCRPAPAAGAAA